MADWSRVADGGGYFWRLFLAAISGGYFWRLFLAAISGGYFWSMQYSRRSVRNNS
jgi:hypothetical protein